MSNKWSNFDRLYEDGIRIEKIAMPIIEEYFNEEPLFHKIDDRFCYYDIINLKTKVKYEVKSFTSCYNTFNTIMLPEEKIKRIPLTDDYVFILVFKNHQDNPTLFSYYYIKYDALIFCDFEIKKTYIKARNHSHLNYFVLKKYITKIK